MLSVLPDAPTAPGGFLCFPWKKKKKKKNKAQILFEMNTLI